MNHIHLPETSRRVSSCSRIAAALLAGAFAGAALLAGASRADAAGGPGGPGGGGAAPYAPGQLIVATRPPVTSAVADIRAGTRLTIASDAGSSAVASTQVLKLGSGENVLAAAARVRRLPGVVYAVPNYLAHAAGAWYPNDQGRTGKLGGWEQLQWNFLSPAGVNAPQAWANLIADHRAGASGVTVAILDTGVAFQKWRKFRRSPDFGSTRFVAPCDLVAGRFTQGRCTNRHPLDRDGHGTFVAGTVAESTNNHIGVTGLAYRASIMPVRVLNGSGLGESSTIANGIRYAVDRGAKVINLSLEFPGGVTPGDIPGILAAIRYAHSRGVVIVAAAGNDSAHQIAYPARAPSVISVGATTADLCLASYSDVGPGLDLVAPGGGGDAALKGEKQCRPGRRLPDISQMTFNNPAHPDRFGLPGGWYGTSMAAPAVSAAAAMVIASGVLGTDPSPEAILARLEQTATPMGTGTPNPDYGYGLLNIGAATSPPPS